MQWKSLNTTKAGMVVAVVNGGYVNPGKTTWSDPMGHGAYWFPQCFCPRVVQWHLCLPCKHSWQQNPHYAQQIPVLLVLLFVLNY